MKDSFKNISISSKRKPDLIETDRNKRFNNIMFQHFLNNNNTKVYSRNSSFVKVFAERFNRSNKDLLKKPVFERRDGNWIDLLLTITKQYNIRIHSSTKLTTIHVSLKKRRTRLPELFRQTKGIQTKNTSKRFRWCCSFKENFLKK